MHAATPARLSKGVEPGPAFAAEHRVGQREEARAPGQPVMQQQGIRLPRQGGEGVERIPPGQVETMAGHVGHPVRGQEASQRSRSAWRSASLMPSCSVT